MEQEIFYDTIAEMVDDLSRENLIDLLNEYSKYINSFYVYHDSGSHPVGLLEYFHNEYLTD
jgi:hypothetical protein